MIQYSIGSILHHLLFKHKIEIMVIVKKTQTYSIQQFLLKMV
jgi:hypothetical protein